MKFFIISFAVVIILLVLIWGIASQRTKEQSRPAYSYSPLFQDLDSELSNVKLPVQGEIPSWISGTLVRNGPAKFHAGEEYLSHWFDGLAMLHAFAIDNGDVVYSNKFLKSDAYIKFQKTGKLSFAGFAEDPCRSIFKNFFAYFFPKEKGAGIMNANVNVAQIADKYVAMTETPLPVRFDIKTLETMGVFDYDDSYPKGDSFESAHPHFDQETGDLINYFIDFGRESFYVFYRIPSGSKERIVIGRIPVDKPAYVHSFAVTDNTIVFVEFPFVVNPLDLMMKPGGFITHFKWEPERGARFHVIDKKKGDVIKKFQTPPFFAFHHVNSFEKGGRLIVDLVAYPDASVIGDPSSSPKSRYLSRYVLDLTDGGVQEEKIFGSGVEMPRINYERFNGLPYTYAYAIATSGDNALLKLNVENGEAKVWKEEGCFPSEPVFLASPEGAKEDQGIVLSVVLDAEKNGSFLLVLDGESFQEIARAAVPHTIPFGLHGNFFKPGK